MLPADELAELCQAQYCDPNPVGLFFVAVAITYCTLAFLAAVVLPKCSAAFHRLGSELRLLRVRWRGGCVVQTRHLRTCPSDSPAGVPMVRFAGRRAAAHSLTVLGNGI